MDPEQIERFLNFFMILTVALAVAVLMLCFLFLGMYLVLRRMATWMEGISKDLLRNVDAITAKADEALTIIKSAGEDLKTITEKVNTATEIVHNRLITLDAFLDDTTSKAQQEVILIQDMIELASQRFAETIETFHRCVLVPVNEISAVTRGISAGIGILFRRRKKYASPSP